MAKRKPKPLGAQAPPIEMALVPMATYSAAGEPGQEMAIEWWPIERVKPYPGNPRKISDRAVDKVAASIQEFGWRQPIVVDREDTIVVGHTRLLGGLKLKLARVPVHVAWNLTPAQIKAYRLADNRTNQEAEWDSELLVTELGELKALDFDLALTGFDIGEIAKLGSKGLTDEDAVPAVPERAVTVPGDCWLCGTHRVVCGDATSFEAIARLCGSTKANLVFTDPPYNVDYEGYTEERLKINGDRMTGEQFSQFLLEAFTALHPVLDPEGSMYICHPSLWQREFQNALEAAGFEVRCQIVWAKNTFAWGFGRYKFQHEPIFYAHLKGKSDAWYGDKSQSTLWQENKPAANRLHPTMKPVELIARALVNSTQAGDTVLDVFGGSGSTLIACQQHGRVAALLEIDPRYVDVTVNRWQEFTGERATLESDGRTFADVAAGRVA